VTGRGELERAVIEVLWDSGLPMTARAVTDALASRDLALTTVLTVLGRLETKGLVWRSREGRAHTYRAVSDRAEHTAGLMRQVLDTAGDRQDALTRFVDTVSADDLAALRRALDEH
jgi:predicted transcriptional regulator